jgi:sulfate transport system substrate-binding protein
MNQASDVDFLVEKGLVVSDYAKRFPNNAAIYLDHGVHRAQG